MESWREGINSFPESQRGPRGKASLAGPEARPTQLPNSSRAGQPSSGGGRGQSARPGLPSRHELALHAPETSSPFLSPFLEPK